MSGRNQERARTVRICPSQAYTETCKDDPEVWRIYNEVYRIQAERDFRREQERIDS